jgi:hypothetical protein
MGLNAQRRGPTGRRQCGRWRERRGEWGSETDYGAGVFTGSDFARLAVHLGSIKGRFIMSVNDVPEMREVFARFSIEASRPDIRSQAPNGLMSPRSL